MALNANGKIALSEYAEYIEISLASLSGSDSGNARSEEGAVGASEGSPDLMTDGRSGEIDKGDRDGDDGAR